MLANDFFNTRDSHSDKEGNVGKDKQGSKNDSKDKGKVDNKEINKENSRDDNNSIEFINSKMPDPRIKYDDYRQFEPKMDKILWPTRYLEQAPIWCSVDLRDGNQALRKPMTIEQKLEFWNMLIKIGFKEIEIGFPAASKVEYDFTRYLIEYDLIPDDVTVQVLSQCRKEQIEKTMECLKGAKRAIVHLYNSTSIVQREDVFHFTKEQTINLALTGVNELKKLTNKTDTKIIFEYSPESFTGTEPDFAIEICNKVIEAWGPTEENKMIINLPATVERTFPDIFANQVEYFSTNVKNRNCIILSVHPHNDMGCAISAGYFALKAGADRVEGTLFGNGERTGNLDIYVLASDLRVLRILPNLDFSDANYIKNVYEKSTGMKINPRHPFIGNLVFIAFSGSHQDAINKCFKASKERKDQWNNAYLLIDPSDYNLVYEAVVVNSQSGKGGISFKINSILGFDMPKEVQADFSHIVQDVCEDIEKRNQTLSNEDLVKLFFDKYFKKNPNCDFLDLQIKSKDDEVYVSYKLHIPEKEYNLHGKGENEIKAVKDSFFGYIKFPYIIDVIKNHSMSNNDGEMQIASYVKITNEETGKIYYGVGVGINHKIANINAVFSAINNIEQ